MKHNIITIMNELTDNYDIPDHIINALEGCNEFYEIINTSEEQPSELDVNTLNQLIDILTGWYDNNIDILEQEIEPKHEPLGMNYFEKYPFHGFLIPKKIKAAKLLHEIVGFPAKIENIDGKRELCRFISHEIGLSKSTVYEVINLVLAFDKN